MIEAVGDERHLARALDLPRHAALVLGAEPRSPSGQDLTQFVHITFQIIGVLIS